MSVTIPLRSDLPWFDEQAVLDGVTYTLEFRWSERASRWLLSVRDGAGQATYVEGVQLVEGYPVVATRPAALPPGALILVDTLGQGAEAGQGDLGTRHHLLYFAAAELAP